MALASARKFEAYGQVKIPGKVSLISQVDAEKEATQIGLLQEMSDFSSYSLWPSFPFVTYRLRIFIRQSSLKLLFE